ncbi:maleylpyruvate isomerase family mycothiol-dependent enzyme [Salinibacterium sp. G-O1]|uniref:maleylpyruvate isomerase family mycothiol-dependent enzyme n=1 Tax=Salinibacterium sp. G-O1 TaxID=3046208 RepID=UPI0024BB617E|nr:maleylpyruvate isomerase family mycothiol-dependent enzyme [Salinibacterium sp. G-O1]MDJ0335014.1 maleylpyruvate isomerase family mycothiol-dependent enzyme [Salinibacterium sp. G-O1]
MTHPDPTWAAVHIEREALIDDMSSLESAQWATQSLCPDWDVHDVVAHLVDTAKTTRLGFIKRMFSARFDFDRDNAEGVAREKRSDPRETLSEFRRVLLHTSSPPAALATRLVEAFVHGEDIRRPLGIGRDYPPEHVASALSYQVRTGVTMGGGKERAQGLRLVATDAGCEHGSGPEVRSTAIALLLAVSGRPVPAAEFAGPGAPTFLGRTSR